MAKRKKQSEYMIDPTSVALAVACLGGVGAFQAAEILYDALRGSGTSEVPGLPSWRAHMGSVCLGVFAFVITLFLLEALGRKSKVVAWRSSAPWLPLIALTAVATAVHIPIYAVIPAGALYSVWAYRRTRAVR